MSMDSLSVKWTEEFLDALNNEQQTKIPSDPRETFVAHAMDLSSHQVGCLYYEPKEFLAFFSRINVVCKNIEGPSTMLPLEDWNGNNRDDATISTYFCANKDFGCTYSSLHKSRMTTHEANCGVPGGKAKDIEKSFICSEYGLEIRMGGGH